ncbi:Multiple RNA-binding domain-containing protein 1 [Golovinomyces cichoracearum]|uniref:Multiple RNA-binding domain-containing protein 1 n=1 Tax=Golovinomyces cichoracearum TaxID=62708 RepID=A0A420IUY1_9PEZI|nr:Multiple RNA-binding domain-containing protein 1 [Golovinomyces cichoracearum]
MLTMTSSRIFIKGLPPTMTTQEFESHFSKLAAVTDVRLIPRRRIGYVGYKTPEDAIKMVKYFNRTFIRMSKISVEIARPIADTAISPSSKATTKVDERINEVENAQTNQGSKRKRDTTDDSQQKLREYLDVMLPPSKTTKWDTKNPNAELESDTVTQQDINQIQSSNIHKTHGDLVKLHEKSNLDSPKQQTLDNEVLVKPLTVAANNEEIAMSSITDEEWLRGRTNRLLDLVEPEYAIEKVSKVEPQPDTESKLTVTVPTSSQNEEREASISAQEPISNRENSTDSEFLKKSARLFVRNLPYSATEEDLQNHFSSFAIPEEIHISVDASGKSKGFAHIQYLDPNSATEAIQKYDGKPFQGRLLHIMPGYARRDEKLDESALAKLPYLKKKQITKKSEAAASKFSWNSLYMDQDAVNTSIANRLGVSKSELLDPVSGDSAWKQALAETSVIQETKVYFKSKGVDLESFKKYDRGDTAILVKNFTYGTTIEELRKIFEEFGEVTRALMPPSGTIAIVEFKNPVHAKAAFANLAYRRVKDSVLFLEKAPRNLFISANIEDTNSQVDIKSVTHTGEQRKISVSDLLENQVSSDNMNTSTLYVRNLNFVTSSQRLTELFKPLAGFMSARVSTKPDPKKPGQVLSMGFGFLEFKSKGEAESALKAMDGFNLDGHNLVIKISHKGLDAAEERRNEDRMKKESAKRTKIIIKNLPFEATKKDVRNLFGTYGKLRSVRLPKKFNNSIRGFAFADFISSREAENALEALKNTHLLGRRLVLEFAAADAVDAEEEIEKMQRKVSSQVNRMALQKLTGGGRRKFNLDGNDENEEI